MNKTKFYIFFLLLINLNHTYTMFNSIKVAFWPDNYRKEFINALRSKDLARAKRILEAGLDINAKDYHGNTILINEIQQLSNQNNWNGLQTIYPWNNQQNNNAQEKIDYSTIQFLLDNGTQINLTNNAGETALHEAAKGTSDILLQLLLTNGADKNIINHSWQTAFDIAKMHRKNNLISLFVPLIKHDLKHAIENHDINAFKKAIKQIGSICLKDKNGNNLLHLLIPNWEQKKDFIKIIIKANPELLNQKNKLDLTPLELSVSKGGEFVRFLLGLRQ